MNLARSWLITERPDSGLNVCYDRLRCGVNRTLFRFIAPRALQGRKLRILEAGSGPAFAASLFAKDRRVGSCLAMDIDPQALEVARSRDPSLRVVLGDLNDIPLADDSFDLVFNSSTVEHLDDPGRAVREMSRVCRPGGRVFVGVPQRLGPLGFQPLVKNTAAGDWIGPVFNRRQLDDLLERAGLVVQDHLSYFFRFFIGAIGSPRP